MLVFNNALQNNTVSDVCLYVMYEEHGEDDVNAADGGDAGCVHPFITGSQMLRMRWLRFADRIL